ACLALLDCVVTGRCGGLLRDRGSVCSRARGHYLCRCHRGAVRLRGHDAQPWRAGHYAGTGMADARDLVGANAARLRAAWRSSLLGRAWRRRAARSGDGHTATSRRCVVRPVSHRCGVGVDAVTRGFGGGVSPGKPYSEGVTLNMLEIPVRDGLLLAGI